MKPILLIFLLLIFIKGIAQPTFTMSSSICEQNSLFVTSINGTLSISGYTWTSNPLGVIITSPNAPTTSITYPSAGTYTITLAATDGTNLYTFSNTITVNALPTFSLSTATPTPICPPPTNIGGLSLSADNGALNYTWMPGSYSGGNINVYPQPASNTTYTVSGSDMYGCVSTSTIYILVYPLPSLFVSSNSPVCAGNNICLNASGSLLTYFWSGPCSYSSFSQNNCFSSVVSCGGIYTVGGSDANSCANSATINVIVNVSPSLSVTSSNSILCVGQSATLTANGASTYSWTPGGIGNPLVIFPSTNTSYTVNGMGVGGCIGSAIFTQSVSSCTEVTEILKDNETIIIYPNPFINEILIETFIPINSPFKIYNILGEVVYSSIINSNKFLITLLHLENGIYYFQIGSLNKKLIKQ